MTPLALYKWVMILAPPKNSVLIYFLSGASCAFSARGPDTSTSLTFGGHVVPFQTVDLNICDAYNSTTGNYFCLSNGTFPDKWYKWSFRLPKCVWYTNIQMYLFSFSEQNHHTTPSILYQQIIWNQEWKLWVHQQDNLTNILISCFQWPIYIN